MGSFRSRGTLVNLQYSFRYPRSEPNCMRRPVSEHDQPHIRSPFMTAAPTSRLRRAKAQEDENHSRKRRFRPWLASVRLPGSARTDQVLEDNGIRLDVFVRQAAFIVALLVTTPVVTYFQSATSSFRASATIVVLRRRPPFRRTRS